MDPMKPAFRPLKDKHRLVREQNGFPKPLSLRVHRSLSWLGQAEQEQEKIPPNIDVCFILLWIGFNAAYASASSQQANNERTVFNSYFNDLVKMDNKHKIYDAIWKRFSNEVRILLDNQYTYAPFWSFHNGDESCSDWEKWLGREKLSIHKAMRKFDTSCILSILFRRLYVLRNQLIHGGSTFNSSTNRNQVRDGSAVMKFLLPIFIDIMMDNPDHDWGEPLYPVMES